MMLCYNYDRHTKRFLSSCDAEADPEEPAGRFLLPAHATFVPVPNFPNLANNYKFDEASQTWLVVDAGPDTADRTAAAWAYLRSQRNARLAATDWMFTVRDRC